MKKRLCFMAVAMLLTSILQSCSSDKESDNNIDNSIKITELDVLGTWEAKVNGVKATFQFDANKSYLAIFGDNRYKGTWKIEGNTVHGTTIDPIEEYFTFKSLSGSVAQIYYRNSIGDTYDITATKKDDVPVPYNPSITLSLDKIDVPAEGGVYYVSVKTTGNEWGAFSESDFITIKLNGSNSNSGTLEIVVQQNPTTSIRSGSITIMSGSERKTVSVSQAAFAGSTYDAPEGYTLVWQDEFNDGSELNASDWTHEVQNSGWVNNELQNYVNHTTPEGAKVTELKNGALHITALKENGKVYSGRVYAKMKQGWTYGYIEASIKLPKGKGTWPAFWMMPVNFMSWPADGEIDIMEEVGYHPNYVSSSLHANAHVHSNNTQVTHEMKCDGAEDDFHKYAILWTSKNITTYVDGKVQLSYDNRGLGRDDWPYDDLFYIIFNLAWGGDWGGLQGVDEKALPATMEIDYIRVFQKK